MPNSFAISAAASRIVLAIRIDQKIFKNLECVVDVKDKFLNHFTGFNC